LPLHQKKELSQSGQKQHKLSTSIYLWNGKADTSFLRM
jgi:hypothetical protein